MTNDYYMLKNGIKFNDKQVATDIANNLHYDDFSAEARVDAQLDYLVANFTNVHQLNIANALQHLWYYIIGISTTELWKYIDKRAEELAEAKKIRDWNHDERGELIEKIEDVIQNLDEYYESDVIDAIKTATGLEAECYDGGIDDGCDSGEDEYVMKACFSIKEKNITIRIYYGNNTLEIGYCDIR